MKIYREDDDILKIEEAVLRGDHLPEPTPPPPLEDEEWWDDSREWG